MGDCLYVGNPLWSKTNRLPVISPAKMGLFRICRELQLRSVARGREGKGEWRKRRQRKEEYKNFPGLQMITLVAKRWFGSSV